MPSKPDISFIGKRFGRLVVIKHIEGKHWLCKCDCGNDKIANKDSLIMGHTKSCGCLVSEVARKNGSKSRIDLSGKRIGKLTVLEYKGHGFWLCKCDCGNTKEILANNLTRKKKPTQSCGCANTLEAANKTNFVCGTNAGNVARKEAMSRSKTGIKGVHLMATGMYHATIGWQGKQYVLCRSYDINKCIAARKAAEARYHSDFLEWYKKYRAGEITLEELEDSEK